MEWHISREHITVIKWPMTVFTLLSDHANLSKIMYSFTLSTGACEDAHFSKCLPTHWYGQCYDWNHSNGRTLVYHCGFIVHSSDDWWGEHLFVCVSFCELSSDMFCPFLNCLLFLLYFQGSLHILEMSLLFAFLCYEYILVVCGSYFSFCSNVFQRTKVLTFIIPHLPTFYSLCFHFVILRIPLVSFVLSVFV